MMMNPTAGTRAEPSLVVPPVPGTYDETAVQRSQGAGYLGGESSPTPQGDATVSIESAMFELLGFHFKNEYGRVIFCFYYANAKVMKRLHSIKLIGHTIYKFTILKNTWEG